MKTCPKCKQTTATTDEEIQKLFGLRVINGKYKAQSWCRNCRGGKAAAAVTELPMITTDLGATRSLYKLFYPGDTNADKRSWKFCVQKMQKSHSGKIQMSPQSIDKLQGVA